MRHRILDTFTGPFALIQHDDGSIVTTWITNDTRATLAESRLDPRLLPDLARRLKAYFKDEEVDFSDVETPFSSSPGNGQVSQSDGFYRRCWNACRRIQRGHTCSYGQLAALAGSREAARAAGQAMRHNPLPIIIPCHRVVSSGGKLHGFGGTCDGASSALAVKRALLRMEGAAVAREPGMLLIP